MSGTNGMRNGVLVFAAGMALGLAAMVAELGFLKLTSKKS